MTGASNILNVLIFGASYGAVFATKLLTAGHRVTLICTPAEAALVNKDGLQVHFPASAKDGGMVVDSNRFSKQLSACSPDTIDPALFDLVVLAMQEP